MLYQILDQIYKTLGEEFQVILTAKVEGKLMQIRRIREGGY